MMKDGFLPFSTGLNQTGRASQTIHPSLYGHLVMNQEAERYSRRKRSISTQRMMAASFTMRV